MKMFARTLPSNTEVEESILVSCLLDASAIEQVVDILTPKDFYKTIHQEMFKAMIDLHEDGRAMDVTLIESKVDQSGTILGELLDVTPIAVNLEYYCEIVKGEAIKRCLIEQSNAIIKHCFSKDSASDILDKSQQRLVDIQFDTNKKTSHSFNELITDRIDFYEDLQNHPGRLQGVLTGISGLDKSTCGFQPSDLVLIAGRPGTGKSSFADDIGRVAAKREMPGLVFSLEMSKEQWIDRSISSEGMIDFQKMRTGNLDVEDWYILQEGASRLHRLAIEIDDSGGVTCEEIRRRARRAKKKHGIKWVIIDYLQLIKSPQSHSRDREVGLISAFLKASAKELNIPFIVLCQLNRQVENRSIKRPQLSDLRESGNLEQDADVVVFLYRPKLHGEEEEYPGHAEIILAKNRQGPSGKKIEAIFFEGQTTFKEKAGDTY